MSETRHDARQFFFFQPVNADTTADLFVRDSGHERCAPGHRFGPAMRGYFLIHAISSGRGVFECRGQRYPLCAGQGFMIFPEDITVYSASDTDPWSYAWVGFSGTRAEALAAKCGVTREKPVFDLGESAQKAIGILHDIYDDLSVLKQNNTAAVGGLLRFTAYLHQSTLGTLPQNGGADSYRRAVWYLNANFQRSDFHIEDVASFVGLSRSQLFRVFKAHDGLSPQEALYALRLANARRLLRETDLSLTEVAFSSGFASAARMGELFREKLRTTPSAVRKETSI